MASRIYPKRLLVEGKKEMRVIPELLEANGIRWGETSHGDTPVVHIEDFDGIEGLLEVGVIQTELKASGLKTLGIVADADADRRWTRIRQRCIGSFPELPDKLLPNGIVSENAQGLRLGVWLMPDNASHGMLETFLLFLAPHDNDPLVVHARQACQHAKGIGAPFKLVHGDKALIYTWLAWQDEPGAQLHEAVKFKMLDPLSPRAAPFVTWFRTLFQL